MLGVARRPDAQVPRGLFALLASAVVSAGRVLMAGTRVDDRELELARQRDRDPREIVKIDEERLAAAAVDRSELIHQTGARPDELGLRGMGHSCDLAVVQRQAEKPAQRPNERDGERGARTKSGTEWKPAADLRLESIHVRASAKQRRCHAPRAVCPGPIASLGTDDEGRLVWPYYLTGHQLW